MNAISNIEVSNPTSLAVTIGRLLMQALEAEDSEEEERHLEAVQQLLENFDPVQRRNVQQIMESLGGKLWNQTKTISEAGPFPAVKVKTDDYGDMTAIVCRAAGRSKPSAKTIKLVLRKPNLTLGAGLDFFRLETGEPVIIKFSDTVDGRVIHEIIAPFGCISAPGSSTMANGSSFDRPVY